MDWLRISLLILGILLVAGIWTAHHLRSRSRNSARAAELEAWDDEGVHIRAERDDRPPGVRPLGENLSLPLEQTEESVPPPHTRWQPVSGTERPAREVPGTGAGPEYAGSAVANRPTMGEPVVSGNVPGDGVPPPRVGGRNAPASGSKYKEVVADPRAADVFRRTPTVQEQPNSARSQGVTSAAGPDEEQPFDDVSAPRVIGRNPLAARGGREKILILHVVAPRNRPFTGVALGAALRRAGLRLGEMSIYHSCASEGSGDVLFSVANMVAPGTLTDEDLADMVTPGITLFLQLHLCDQPRQAFDALLETSHALARDLGGNIFDAQQSTATNQTLSHMRDELNEWLLRHRPDLLRRKVER